MNKVALGNFKELSMHDGADEILWKFVTCPFNKDLSNDTFFI
jgi:hypothetical protein